MKWSFCAASLVNAAKPVFHLTCRTFVSPFEISVKFVGPCVLANGTRKETKNSRAPPCRGFAKAITFELAAAERALTGGFREVGLHLPSLTSIAVKKRPIWPDLVELRILPHEAVSGFRSAEGKRLGEGRPGDLGHVRSCSNPRPLLWLPQFKFAVNC